MKGPSKETTSLKLLVGGFEWMPGNYLAVKLANMQGLVCGRTVFHYLTKNKKRLACWFVCLFVCLFVCIFWQVISGQSQSSLSLSSAAGQRLEAKAVCPLEVPQPFFYSRVSLNCLNLQTYLKFMLPLSIGRSLEFVPFFLSGFLKWGHLAFVTPFVSPALRVVQLFRDSWGFHGFDPQPNPWFST